MFEYVCVYRLLQDKFYEHVCVLIDDIKKSINRIVLLKKISLIVNPNTKTNKKNKNYNDNGKSYEN